jgi:hypothetical protein
MNDDPKLQGMNDTATRWDLYREIHEAVRDALFGVTTFARQTAPTPRLDAALRRTDVAIARLHRLGKRPTKPARIAPARSCVGSSPTWAASLRAVRCACATKRAARCRR